MDKAYKPQENEDKIYKLWEKGGHFKAKPDKSKKPFTIIMPPPNANGVLHIGHAVFITLEDIMIRYHRMKGDVALWVPGTDHAGIMTQVVYEKKLAEKNKTRFDLGREEFIKQIYDFSMENSKAMENQLRKLGASCDWSRSKFTLDPEISQSVLFTFKKLYDAGLIYQGERIINWCSRCGTALSDLEVDHKEKQAVLYYIKYPIVNSDQFITVATTRPETMLGDTAVAVNPDDKRYKELVSQNIKIALPLTDREIPLIADQRIDLEFGTGAVKITPAHDGLDFEIGQDHSLEAINVIGKEWKMTDQAGEDYAGLKINKAKQKVLENLEKLGLLEKTEDHNSAVSICERCKTVIEPLISKQWFIKAKELAKPAIEAVKKKEIEFVPARFEKLYYHWMENIHDWCISRQIWWGHRIPVYYCECGEVMVEVEQPKKCSKCGSGKIIQDEDTLDTWFSSGQWPFNLFGWPKETKDYDYFYPTTVMETGWDILFFWVARMIMLGIFCTGKVPFKHIYMHGLVRDKNKQKMSKSKGNGIDPLEVIEKHGADALRMALVFGTGPGNDFIVSEEKIVGQRRFANKIWNAARFVLSQKCSVSDTEPLTKTAEDKKIISELNKTTQSVTKNIEEFQFHQSAEDLYHFFWHTFCDKYLEQSKKQIEEGSEEEKQNTKQILLYVLVTSLKLLHPFMPFVTETIYQSLPHDKSHPTLISVPWPKT